MDLDWIWVGGGTVKITSAPCPDHLIFNWNRLERLKIDLEWTRNGPGLDLDPDLSLTKIILIIDDGAFISTQIVWFKVVVFWFADCFKWIVYEPMK